MVLLDVDAQGPSIAPFEGDAPRAVHVDRVASRPPAQRVKVKARRMQRLERRRAVDRRQTQQAEGLNASGRGHAVLGRL